MVRREAPIHAPLENGSALPAETGRMVPTPSIKTLPSGELTGAQATALRQNQYENRRKFAFRQKWESP